MIVQPRTWDFSTHLKCLIVCLWCAEVNSQCQIYTDQEIDAEYVKYANNQQAQELVFEMRYRPNGEEDKKMIDDEDRKAIFKTNVLDTINKNNAKQIHGCLIINTFTVLSFEEFRELYGINTLKQTLVNGERVLQAVHAGSRKRRQTIAETLDWPTGPVDSQGICGNCWIFSAMHAVAGRVAIANGGSPPDLSEQHAMECIFERGTEACTKGNFPGTVWFWLSKSNAVLESQYMRQYDNTSQLSLSAYRELKETTEMCPASLRGSPLLSTESSIASYTRSEEEIIDHLQDGPIVAWMTIGDWRFTDGNGIWVSKNKHFDQFCGRDDGTGAHVVVVVGYGEENGRKYWKAKNSWGDWWGDKGFFKLERESSGRGLSVCSFLMWHYVPQAVIGSVNTDPIQAVTRAPVPVDDKVTTATTSKAATVTVGDCVDSAADCGYWARNGECAINAVWMKQGCPKSCNTCKQSDPVVATAAPIAVKTQKPVAATTQKTQKTSGCSDSHTDCVNWAKSGECAKNPFWMEPNCQKSCNSCGKTLVDVNAPVPKPGCLNMHPTCEFWASTGECISNALFMDVSCKLSCNTC